jgi:DNA/RNA endonuclease G (NUC1)
MARIGLAVAVATLLSGPVVAAPAQWKPGPKNKPTACGTLWRTIGLPQHITTGRDLTFVCHRRYILLHDNINKTPDWVIERLNKATTTAKGGASRKGLSFVSEKLVPPAGRASNADYTLPKANLDRGHMAPAEDFNRSRPLMKESFIYSNAVPQVGDRFNGAIWKDFEAEVRKIALKHGDTFVITGPVRRPSGGDTIAVAESDNACGNRIELKGPHPREKFICAAASGKPDVFCQKGVSVPIGVYKIIYVRATKTAYAFLMPNIDHDAGSDQTGYLDKFRISIAAIESVTGLKFFRELAVDGVGTGGTCAPGRPWVTS